MKVVCVGDCGVDFYSPENKYYQGGITANFTKQARRLFKPDDDIHIVSMIGNDGEPAELAFNSTNLDGITCHIEHHTGRTPVQYISIMEDGEKNFTRYDEGVLKEFSLTENQVEVIETADLIMTPVYQQIYNVFELLLEQNIKGTLAADFSDFSDHPDFDLLMNNIEKIDIGFFGLTNEQNQIIDQIQNIAKTHNKLLVVTLGPDGSIVFSGDRTFKSDAVKVKKVVDTTGAGDAFAAGFLSSYMHEKSISRAVETGAIIAAKTIAHKGAIPSLSD